LAFEQILTTNINIGCVVGQIGFGLLGDAFGRSAVYGKELILIIVATIFTISVPSWFSGHQVLVWIFVCRIILGIGVGGDYPMSATVVSDRANVHRRGTMLCFIFANQGWGSFVGAIVTIVSLEAFKSDIRSGHPKHIDRIWRVIIGLSLVPAFAVLYQRLTLPESRKFTLTKESADNLAASEHHKEVDHKEKDLESNDSPRVEPADAHEGGERHGVIASKKASWQEFLHYFKEWPHLKVLLGTTLGWFFVDIAFYGINVRLFHFAFFHYQPLTLVAVESIRCARSNRLLWKGTRYLGSALRSRHG
jgi:PHS family inorganic phosphate transporter-like MFS transporter